MIQVAAIALSSIFMILAFNAMPAASKGTVVNNDITEDARWTLAGSPYILDGRVVTIQNYERPVTLTIDAGVEIQSRSYKGDMWGINPTKHGGITVARTVP